MATEAKKKRLTYRIGFVFGWLSARYRRFEASMLRWTMEKGMPATLASLLSGLVRLSLVGAFLCVAFGVVVTVIGFILCKEILLSSSETEKESGEVIWMDGEQLFPDPYSPENINDPAFHKFD
ncbi:DUF3742 family protein [Pseudomonas vanderleydeniana]|uniref:DUF3742 family protein n=1 Tax=Pseudomonas vanderleydeniana TaxID=2745495 RepID=A0A9E6PGX7_9PSED|nr:DUF3742 family protein [Pseudomonas vanderleydeniana]QXI26361.1 DUF3742 family protein [Pseudomonas vanderleydeniana]